MLGDNIRERRIHKRISQAKLAEDAGLSQGVISSIEKGYDANPGVRTILAIANSLGCQIGELLDGTGKTTNGDSEK